MSRLLLDYEGEVDVSEEGGIAYRFEALRRTVDTQPVERPRPIWARLKKLVPLTGNSAGSNLGIAALNGFNLLMSWIALTGHWTFEKIAFFFEANQRHMSASQIARLMPPDSTAIAL